MRRVWMAAATVLSCRKWKGIFFCQKSWSKATDLKIPTGENYQASLKTHVRNFFNLLQLVSPISPRSNQPGSKMEAEGYFSKTSESKTSLLKASQTYHFGSLVHLVKSIRYSCGQPAQLARDLASQAAKWKPRATFLNFRNGKNPKRPVSKPTKNLPFWQSVPPFQVNQLEFQPASPISPRASQPGNKMEAEGYLTKIYHFFIFSTLW